MPQDSAAVAVATKRTRRTKTQMELLRAAIYVLAEEHRPCTVRQIFFQRLAEGDVSAWGVER